MGENNTLENYKNHPLFFLPVELIGQPYLTPRFLRSLNSNNTIISKEIEEKRKEIFNKNLKDVIDKVLTSSKKEEEDLYSQSSSESKELTEMVPNRLAVMEKQLFDPLSIIDEIDTDSKIEEILKEDELKIPEMNQDFEDSYHSLNSKFLRWFNSLEKSKKSQLSLLIENIYKSNSNVDIERYLTSSIIQINNVKFVLFHLDTLRNIYTPILSHEIDSETITKFVFTTEDRYFLSEKSLNELKITENLKLDPYFLKKFSSNELEKLQSILIKKIDDQLILFGLVNKTQDSQELTSIFEKIEAIFFPIIPILYLKNYSKIKQYSPRDLFSNQVEITKTFVEKDSNKKFFYYLILHDVNNFSAIKMNQFLEILKTKLTSNPVFIKKNFNTILILTNKNEKEKINLLTKSQFEKFEIHEKVYPNLGHNIYIYC